MNTGDKKSSAVWAEQLFRKSKPHILRLDGKSHYTHKYHASSDSARLSPFDELFNHVGAGSQKVQTIEMFSNEEPFKQAIYESKIQTPSNSSKVDHRPALWNSSEFKVLNSYQETPDTKTFRLVNVQHDICDYLPGQYVTLSINIAGQELKRSYSLASNPNHSALIELTVKRAPNGGIFSNWLNNHVQIGDSLTLKGPFGKFTCANDARPKLLLIAAGSGIVPLMSMLRWITANGHPVNVELLFSFRTVKDIIYWDELKLIAARNQNIKLNITLTNPSSIDSGWLGLNGRITEAMLTNLVPDLAGRSVYLCGPEAFMAACKAHLNRLGLPEAQLFQESYAVQSPKSKPFILSHSADAAHLNRSTFSVNFAKSGKTILVNSQSTLLEVAENSGICIEHQCRNGNCGECMVKCLKGKVAMSASAEIDDFDRSKGWIYTCCAYPASNLVLDA